VTMLLHNTLLSAERSVNTSMQRFWQRKSG